MIKTLTILVCLISISIQQCRIADGCECDNNRIHDITGEVCVDRTACRTNQVVN